MNKIIIRRANWQDCDDIYRWRNDKETRKASFDFEVITYDTHKEWFRHSLENPGRFIYIAENETGKKIGVVRLDRRNNHVVEFDINLAPKMRGKGYGARLIQEACQCFALESSCLTFIARAKQDNPASIKVFKKAGFFEMFDYVDARWGGVVVLARLFGQWEFGREDRISSHRRGTSGTNKKMEKF